MSVKNHNRRESQDTSAVCDADALAPEHIRSRGGVQTEARMAIRSQARTRRGERQYLMTLLRSSISPRWRGVVTHERRIASLDTERSIHTIARYTIPRPACAQFTRKQYQRHNYKAADSQTPIIAKLDM
jgi:hypothetical protein